MKAHPRHPHQQLLVLPDDGVGSIVELIDQAEEQLLVKQFKLQSDTILTSLIRASERGVTVRVMLNPRTSGGDRWNDSAFKRLESLGIAVAWSCDAFHVTHEKSMVIDGHSVLIATFNLADKHFGDTRDYGVVSQDPRVVSQVIAGFDADWSRRVFQPDLNLGLLWSSGHSRRPIATLIDSATTTLWLQHPKFADAVVMERILAARDRGVKVRVLCGGKHGLRPWDLLDTMASLRTLARFGVKVRRQRHLKLHAKLILVDGKVAQTGSMNIDRSAFDLRRELGIESDSPPVVSRLLETFQSDWSQASRYHPPDPLGPSREEDGELPDDPHFVHD